MRIASMTITLTVSEAVALYFMLGFFITFINSDLLEAMHKKPPPLWLSVLLWPGLVAIFYGAILFSCMSIFRRRK